MYSTSVVTFCFYSIHVASSFFFFHWKNLQVALAFMHVLKHKANSFQSNEVVSYCSCFMEASNLNFAAALFNIKVTHIIEESLFSTKEKNVGNRIGYCC